MKPTQQLNIEQIQQRVYLTNTELKLLTYLRSNNRSKDVNAVCGLLGMSKHRLTKTKRSLDHKLSRLEMKKDEG